MLRGLQHDDVRDLEDRAEERWAEGVEPPGALAVGVAVDRRKASASAPSFSPAPQTPQKRGLGTAVSLAMAAARSSSALSSTTHTMIGGVPAAPDQVTAHRAAHSGGHGFSLADRERAAGGAEQRSAEQEDAEHRGVVGVAVEEPAGEDDERPSRSPTPGR